MKISPLNDFSAHKNKRNDSSVLQFDNSNQVSDWNQSTSQSAWATPIEVLRLQPSTSSSLSYPTSESCQNSNLNSNSFHTNFREKTTREDNDNLPQSINTWAYGHLKSSTHSSNIHKSNENSELITSPAGYVSQLAALQTKTERNSHRMKHPKNRDPRYEVDFFKVQQFNASGPGVDARPSQDNDLTRFAHLIKPPVEIDGIESSSQPIPVTVNDEISGWHQGLFECHKTGWKMMLAFALCPDITTFMKIDRQACKKDPIMNLLCIFLSIQHKVILLGLLLFIIIPMLLYKTLVHQWLLFLFPLLMPCTLKLYWAAHCVRRRVFEESYNIRPNHCCLEFLIICVYCEPCSLCQLYSELEYQKNIRGPENVIIHRT